MNQIVNAVDGGDQFLGDEDAALADGTSEPLHDASLIDEVVDQISNTAKDWVKPTDAIAIGRQRWLPDLVRERDSGVLHVLHVHIASSMPRYIVKRLRGVATVHRVFVALQIESLYDEELLRLLADLDAEVIVIEKDSGYASAYYLAALADNSIPIAPPLRRELAGRCWDRRREGTNHEKGRHFEGLLAFLLSQVAGFTIFSRNFNGATDEIDIVVRVTSFSDACWSEPGVPFVIVEAKNRSEVVGAPVVTLLIRKLQTRRGRARIGLLFSTSSFSSDAREEELKEAQGQYCVAMLGPAEIGDWIATGDLTRYLDEFVAKAMLR